LSAKRYSITTFRPSTSTDAAAKGPAVGCGAKLQVSRGEHGSLFLRGINVNPLGPLGCSALSHLSAALPAEATAAACGKRPDRPDLAAPPARRTHVAVWLKWPVAEMP